MILLPSDGPLPAPFLPTDLVTVLVVVLLPSILHPRPGTHLPAFSFSVLSSPVISLPFPSGFSTSKSWCPTAVYQSTWKRWSARVPRRYFDRDHTAFSNWKFFHVQLKLLELLQISIIDILSRSGGRRHSGGFFYSPTLVLGNVPADLA